MKKTTLSLLLVVTVALFAVNLQGVNPIQPALAHHGWTSFDLSRPVYLRGIVREARWTNPHVEVRLEVAPDLNLPAGLADLDIPDSLARVGGRESLQKAKLPATPGKIWTVELAPPTRQATFGLREAPVVGSELAVVGYINREECELIRIELLILPDNSTVSQRNTVLPQPNPAPNPCNPDAPAEPPASEPLAPVMPVAIPAVLIAVAVSLGVTFWLVGRGR